MIKFQSKILANFRVFWGKILLLALSSMKVSVVIELWMDRSVGGKGKYACTPSHTHANLACNKIAFRTSNTRREHSNMENGQSSSDSILQQT